MYKRQIVGYIVSNADGRQFLGKSWNEYLEAQLEDIEQKKYELNKVITPLQDVRIIVGDYYIDARPTSPIRFGDSEKENNEVLCCLLYTSRCV